jgi:EpsI family protein
MIKPVHFVIAAVMFMITAGFIYTHRETTVPTNRPFASFPATIGSWQMANDYGMSDAVLNKLRPTDFLSRTYRNAEGQTVTLYVGYHGGGEGGGELHSPKHCLPGSGWFELATKKQAVTVGERSIKAVRSIYQKGDAKEIFLYWFQVRSASLDNEYALKLAQIRNSFLAKRRDATFVRISVPVTTDDAAAISQAEQFVRDLWPVLKDYLPA